MRDEGCARGVSLAHGGLDLENPFYMTLERLEGLITAEPPGEIRAYLFGLYDMRRAAVYARGA
ncbi:hypothetical protein Barb4_04784 [Bacteroidales bacterium Barb4]|nr:hypothetical protein Barb4_04784 [Bacteroidales bacterium Barb4]